MNWKRKLYYSLSPSLRRLARRIYYLPVDLVELISGKRGHMTPPRGKIFIGPGDFTRLGEKLRSDLIEYGGLMPGHRVLDIGCGIGRLAIPLTRYLDKTGSYHGFDVVKEGIDWCRKKITPAHPNFTFLYTPIKNDLYNLNTERTADDFKFPFGSGAFDFVILTSVFTHMQPGGVRNYLHEISRVMDRGATCFATFFIISEESAEFLSKTPDPFFPYEFDTYYLHDKHVKDANIAFKQVYLEQWIADAGLKTVKFYPGWWAGREKSASVDFQDVLILRKP